MEYELTLTKANRLRLAQAFACHKRVDYAIDCAIEGQMGKVYVDSPAAPTAFCLRVGPFCYFAGDPAGDGARQLLQSFPPYHLLMPSAPGWVEAAQALYAGLRPMDRYSFSAEALSAEHLRRLVAASPCARRLTPLTATLAAQLSRLPDSYLDLSDFDSAEDFAARGLGYAVRDGEVIQGTAYASLVCSRGIEVSVFVDEPYRRQGVGTAVGGQLLWACLQRGLRPNWDAANPESCQLARKLGLVFTGSYAAYWYPAG